MSKQFYCILSLVACILTAGSAVAGFWPDALQPYFMTGSAVGVAISTWMMRSPLNHDDAPKNNSIVEQ